MFKQNFYRHNLIDSTRAARNNHIYRHVNKRVACLRFTPPVAVRFNRFMMRTVIHVSRVLQYQTARVSEYASHCERTEQPFCLRFERKSISAARRDVLA